MVAGAGSGKTTSLIKALSAIVESHGDALTLRRQRVACITYTEIAAGEIWNDVGHNSLVHVATIHSFLWSVIKAFQGDIKFWVAARIEEKIDSLRNDAANFSTRVQQRTRDQNQRDTARYEEQRALISKVQSFTYGTGSNYPKGVLGHEDIIKMVPQLISERPLLRTVFAQQYPFVFVDESQDTTKNVVDALKSVDHQQAATFCLGFFGDPMQRIYPTGIGQIALGEGWADITKPENFRCPITVLNVANAIRRDGDGLLQTRGQMEEHEGQLKAVQGSAHLFVLRADEHRNQQLSKVRTWAAQVINDAKWALDSAVNDVKVLVIVHRMAANRLGFGELYAALNDRAPDAFKNGFLDATAWPLRPFVSFVLPLVDAARNGREFDVMQVLRTKSPLLDKSRLSQVDVAGRLAELRGYTDHLTALMAKESGATVLDVLLFLREKELVDFDPRIAAYLTDRAVAPNAGQVEEDGEELTREITSIESYFACPATQLWGYQNYINEESPFSTQQGIKGAEFERVLVVLDDDEGTHMQFSYDKYFGIKELSKRDHENIAEGNETGVERTRRLFYVCCTRALKDLVVVMFSSDPALAEQRIREMNVFDPACIHTADDLMPA
jgi:DNA helicase-2/ATP-dependent DNA helicase PcrA